LALPAAVNAPTAATVAKVFLRNFMV